MAIDPGVSGFGNVQQSYFGGTTEIGTQANKLLYLDDLSPAERKDLLEVIFAAQNPILFPPSQYNIDSSNAGIAIGMSIEQGQHNTIMAMLDTWIESLQVIKEDSEKAALKRTIDGISIAFHSYQHSVSPTMDNNFPTFSVGVVLGAIGVHEALLSTPLTHVAMNPIVDMAVTAVPQLMGDMRAELGLIGTLVIFGVGMQYASAGSQIRNSAEQKFDEKAAAKNFGEQVLSAISDDGFNAYLLAIVSQGSQQSQLNDQGKFQSVALVKMIFLSLALAALYQAEAGRMTGDEFSAMFRDASKDKSAIAFDQGDFKNNFVDGIKQYMKILDPTKLEQFYEAMMTFFDKDPSIGILTNPTKALSEMNKTLRRDEFQA